MNSLKEFRCKICNKLYSSASSLCNHNKKFHSNNVVQNGTTVVLGGINVVQNCQNNLNDNGKQTNILSCCFCKRQFNDRSNKWKHEKKCKQKNKEETIIQQLEIKLQLKEKELQQKEEQFNKAIIEIKKEFIDLLNKNGTVSDKNLKQINKKVQKVNNTYNVGGINNINNGNINNGQINNTYVKFGNLDYTKIFSDKDLRKLMTTHKMMCLDELIKKIHFNDKYPEYGNIFITNLRDNLAYIFDGKEFIATNRTATLVDLVDNHTNEINLSLDNHRAKLDEYTINKIEEMLNKLESEDKFYDENNNKIYSNYKVYKLNNIKTDIYNLSDRKKLELLQSMKLIEKSYDDELLSEDSNYDVKSITV